MKKKIDRVNPITLKKETLLQGIDSGKGVYTACMEEYKKRMLPSRISITNFADMLKLLQPPQSTTLKIENSILTSIKNNLQTDKISLFKIDIYRRIREFNKLIERVEKRSREGVGIDNKIPTNMLNNPQPDISKSDAESLLNSMDLDDVQIDELINSEVTEGDSGIELTTQQKHILYNMLLAEGCTPDEAKEEIENINNTNNSFKDE